MKVVESAFNQEKALVGAFSVIKTFEWNFLKHYSPVQSQGQWCAADIHISSPIPQPDSNLLQMLNKYKTPDLIFSLSFPADKT